MDNKINFRILSVISFLLVTTLHAQHNSKSMREPLHARTLPEGVSVHAKSHNHGTQKAPGVTLWSDDLSDPAS